MENHHDDLVVVLAGYAGRMESLFAPNPGMSSRMTQPRFANARSVRNAL